MDFDSKIEFILEQQARTEVVLQKLAEEHQKTRHTLRWAIRLAVREARAERRRRRELHSEFDEKITKLAAAQLVTEEKLQAFIDSLRRGSNGNPPAA